MNSTDIKSVEELKEIIRPKCVSYVNHMVMKGEKLVPCDKIPWPERIITKMAKKLYEEQFKEDKKTKKKKTTSKKGSKKPRKKRTTTRKK